MSLTQSNQIKGLTKTEYETLREMCRDTKKLYNVGLYSIRQYFFLEGRYLLYESNYHAVKDNENYALLQAGVGQQILKVVGHSFRSFFSLRKKATQGEYRFHDVKIPHYLEKDGYSPLILSTNALVIQNGYWQIPMSHEFARAHPDLERIKVPFAARLRDKTIKEGRILPIERTRFFTVPFIDAAREEPQGVSPASAVAIDLGLDNLAMCVNSTDGAPFLLNGKPLKSINHQYNGHLAKLQSILDLQKLPRSEQMARITITRNNRVHDYMMKAGRYIINYCLNRIGTVIVGYTPDWKHAIHLGTRNNQHFVQIPHGPLRTQWDPLCERYGIRYVEQDESYTSQASFLGRDAMPIGNGSHQHVAFSGKRVKRGLYRTADGHPLNADINGAANILRKSHHRFDFERVARGLLANPLRVKLT